MIDKVLVMVNSPVAMVAAGLGLVWAGKWARRMFNAARLDRRLPVARF